MRFNSKILIRLLIAFCLACVPDSGVAVDDDAAVLSLFTKHVEESPDLDTDEKDEIALLIDEYGLDAAADAITESLIMIHESYGAAVEQADGDDIGVAISELTPFAESEDQFLAADASFYLARSLMNAEKFELAYPLLRKVHGELSDYSVHVGNARFYAGIAQAGLLQYSEAIRTLTDFVQFYPDAPERLRVAAWRQIQQLQAINEGQMADVYQRMDYSRRKLSLIEPGEETQQQQQKIVNMLAKLIKEQEKKEASSSSKDQKNTKQQQQKQQQQANKNKQQSKSQTGGSSSNANGQVVKKAYDDGPASPWSRLRERSRDPANNAIKDKLPARYRDIVERYYEAANKGSGK